MNDVVYVHAFADDPQILRELNIFYRTLLREDIEGLKLMSPVLGKETLDALLRGQSPEFQGRLNGYFSDGFNGVGIWTEWSSERCIDEFYHGRMHQNFSKFAQSTLDKAWYL